MTRWMKRIANRIPLKMLMVLCLMISLMFCITLVAVLMLGVRTYEEDLALSKQHMLEAEYSETMERTIQRMYDAVWVLGSRDVFAEYVLGSRGTKAVNVNTVRNMLNDVTEFVPEINNLVLHLDTGEMLYGSRSASMDVQTYLQISEILNVCRKQQIDEIQYFVPELNDTAKQQVLAMVIPFMNWKVAGQKGVAWFVAFCTVESLTDSLSFSEQSFSVFAGDVKVYGDALCEEKEYLRFDCADGHLRFFVPYDTEENVTTDKLAFRWVLWAIAILLLSETLLVVSVYICMVSPLQDIVHQMRKVTPESLAVHTEAKMRGELGRLVDGINSMLTNVDTLNRECMEQEVQLISLENAHLQAQNLFLQSQINPHFLYNSLECINGMLLSGDRMRATEVISFLARIYRYCTGVGEVCLEEEMELAEEYVHMMNIMRGAEYVLDVHISSGVMEVEMPRMIVQPVVENAIQHGFSHPEIKQGIIRVDGGWNNGILELCISDNGHGMDAEEMAQLNREMHSTDREERIGITNVTHRLMLLYGGLSGVTLSANVLGGVDANIIINFAHEKMERMAK